MAWYRNRDGVVKKVLDVTKDSIVVERYKGSSSGVRINKSKSSFDSPLQRKHNSAIDKAIKAFKQGK